MLTVFRGSDATGADFATVLRVGTVAQCEATRDAVIECLERIGQTPLPYSYPGNNGIAGVTVDATDDDSIVEGNEVVATSNVVSKAVTQRAAGA